MQPEDTIRLRYILDAAHQALNFQSSKRRVDLEGNRQLVWASVKAIENVVESAYHISPDAGVQVPDLDWDKIIAMRHRLVHTYFDINLVFSGRRCLRGFRLRSMRSRK